MKFWFLGLGYGIRPKFVMDGCFEACPLMSLDLGLSCGIRLKFVMDGCFGLAHEDIGLGLELAPKPSSCG